MAFVILWSVKNMIKWTRKLTIPSRSPTSACLLRHHSREYELTEGVEGEVGTVEEGAVYWKVVMVAHAREVVAVAMGEEWMLEVVGDRHRSTIWGYVQSHTT